MGNWNFTSQPEDDRTIVIKTSLVEGDADGSVAGTVSFRGTTYTVNGQWAAKGSVAGRNASIFWFGGNDGNAAPKFLVAAGDLGTHGDANTAFMNIAVTTASSGDGEDYGYNGQLTPY